jgi:hypothetical protein
LSPDDRLHRSSGSPVFSRAQFDGLPDAGWHQAVVCFDLFPQNSERIVSAQRLLFSRRYRAALLDYLLGNGETGLSNAYELGRTAVEEDFGLLQILRAHQRAVNAVLESTQNVPDSLKRLRAAEDFLMETLSPFEMTYRGYVDLLDRDMTKPPEPVDSKKVRRRV